MIGQVVQAAVTGTSGTAAKLFVLNISLNSSIIRCGFRD
jgi:hypothetical protein